MRIEVLIAVSNPNRPNGRSRSNSASCSAGHTPAQTRDRRRHVAPRQPHTEWGRSCQVIRS